MSQPNRSLTTLWVVAVALGLGVGSPRAQAPSPDRPAVRPGRLLVKFRDGTAGCGGCTAVEGRAPAQLPGADALAALEARFGRRSALPLFGDGIASARRRPGGWPAHVAGVRARFPVRSARAHGGDVVPDLSRVYVLTLEMDADVDAAAAAYAASPLVEWAEPDRIWQVTTTPNDPFYGSQGTWGQSYRDLWGLQAIDAGTAWDRSTGAGVVVAVIDTGVDPTHPDLAGNLWSNPAEVPGNHLDDDGNGFVDDVAGWDFVQDDPTPTDQHGHGTHVAGTIAAVGNNGRGVIGVAFGARIMPVRGLGADGSGSTSDLAAAIVYAAENGADILSNSWGGSGQSFALNDAVATARALGAVVLAAAGNNGADVRYFTPAGIPGVIAVAATAASGARAGFSNFGEAISVAAPGVDILSLRGSVSAPVGGTPVANDYLRLSGTSMACPHAAGVAALLLADQAGTTADEVRWHLELSANQPGAVGWEGLPWNPYYGFGVVDAARVFDPVPVTTRVKSPALDLHGYADEVEADVATARVGFTTLDPVPWSVTTPSWLLPAVTNGAGDLDLGFGVDLHGLTPGTYAGTIDVAAPSAIDGGGSVPAQVHVHRDERIGGPIAVGPPYHENTRPAFPPPALASDGFGTFLAWAEEVAATSALFVGRVDGGGGVSTTLLSAQFPQKERVAVAYDGRNYLVVWRESPEIDGRHYDAIEAVRVSPEGAVLDAAPIVVRLQRDANYELFTLFEDLAFDGDAFVVMWTEFKGNGGKTYVHRIGRDGSLREDKPVLVWPSRATDVASLNTYVEPRLACAADGCLMAWSVVDGETTPDGYYVYKVYGTRLVQGRLVDPAPVLLVRDATLWQLQSDGTDYALVADRFSLRAGSGAVGNQVIVARVTAAGQPVDPDGIRIDRSYDGPFTFPKGSALAFDGTNWTTVFAGTGSNAGNQLFVGRLGPGGTVLDDETEGLLAVPHGVVSRDDTFYAAITATHAETRVVWSESTVGVDPPYAYDDQLYVQRLLARPSALPTAAIGAVGPQTVREGEALVFRVAAPSLNPATSVFAASGLPSGAVFDAPTQAFRWMPAGDDAGRTVIVHFEATDSVQVAAEDVAIAVTEGIATVVGSVRLPGNVTPAPGVALELKGGPREKRLAQTDPAGHYRFENLPPGRYKLALGKDAKKRYKLAPRVVRFTIVTGDVTGPDLVATPK